MSKANARSDQVPVKKKRGRPEGWRAPGGTFERRLLLLSPTDWVRVEAAAAVEGVSVSKFLRTVIVKKLDRI